MRADDESVAGPAERSGQALNHGRLGFVVLVAATVLALTACDGGSPSPPHVANLGKRAGDTRRSTTSTLPTGNATQLLNEWATCMRSHGDPSQADPTIDANQLIHITMSPSVPGGLLGPNGQSGAEPVPGSYCAAYLTGAINALQGAEQADLPSQSALEKYAKCMRANGVPDFPDPGGAHISPVPDSDLNPRNPSFEQAGRVCTKKTGVNAPDGGGPLPPGTVVSGPPGQPGMPTLVYVGDDAGG